MIIGSARSPAGSDRKRAEPVITAAHRRADGPDAGCASGPVGVASYRYWPVFDAVSIARPVASFLPVTSVRM